MSVEKNAAALSRRTAKSRNTLYLACTVGIFSFLCLLSVALYLALFSGSALLRARGREPALFLSSRLRAVDGELAIARENPARLLPFTLGEELDALEERCVSAENLLSVLKRRRALSVLSPPSLAAYRAAAERAFKKYPANPRLAAVAAEARVSAATTIFSAENDALRAALAAAAGLIADKRDAGDLVQGEIAFYLYALSGALKTVALANTLPRIPDLMAVAAMSARGGERENLLIDASLLTSLDSEAFGGAARPFDALAVTGKNARALPRPLLDFAAAFAYDFGDPLQAADFYLEAGGDDNYLSAADAFYLGGNIPAARLVWENLRESDTPLVRFRALYNLGLSADFNADKIDALAALVADIEATNADQLDWEGEMGAMLSGGIIRYSRLLGTQRAVSLLGANNLWQKSPLLDLELTRQGLSPGDIAKNNATVWLLIARHPATAEIYQWAAWYFDFQRQYGELAILWREAANNDISGDWIAFHHALEFMRESDFSAAYEILAKIAENGTPLWQVHADLALIYRAQRRNDLALAQFERAYDILNHKIASIPALGEANLAELSDTKREAARIAIGIARLYDLTGRQQAMRAMLDNARLLDPDNLQAPLLLRRLRERDL